MPDQDRSRRVDQFVMSRELRSGSRVPSSQELKLLTDFRSALSRPPMYQLLVRGLLGP